MSVTSGFFNSLNGDRKYSADQMSALFDNLITDGVFSNVGTAFSVRAGTGNSVTIGVGRAWFNSTWLYNSALLPMPLDSSEVFLDRIDAIVIEIDRNDAVRNGSIRVVKGLPSGKPQRPTLANEEDLHQHPLAYIYRKAGSSSVAQADITSMIGTSDCPYVTGILQTQSIDSIIAQWQNEFENWLGTLQDILEGDVAANLANRILTMEDKFSTLAREHAIYDDLEDSNGDVIKDSSGIAIFGTTVLGDIIVPDSNPGEVIPAVESDPFEVGDLLTTARTDLDEKWLLCNGTEVSAVTYPKLRKAFPFVLSTTWKDSVLEKGSGYYYTQRMRCVNGKIFILFETTNGLMYLDDVTGEVHKCNLNSSTSIGVYDLIYVDEYYIAVGHITDSGAYVWYTKDPGGSWTQKGLSSASSRAYAYGAAYVNGHIVVCGQCSDSWGNTNYASIWYATSVTDSFTRNDLVSNISYSPNRISGIIYRDGYYIVCGTYSSSNSDHQATIWYSTALAGSWTRKTIQGGLSGFTYLYYLNGHYVITIENSRTFLYTTDFKSSWKYVDRLLEDNDKYGFNTSYLPLDMVYEHGHYAFAAIKQDYNHNIYHPVVAYSSSLDGPWRTTELVTSVTYTENSSTNVGGIAYDGVHFVISGCMYNSNTSEYILLFAYTDENRIRLPAISLSDSMYTYVKALE